MEEIIYLVIAAGWMLLNIYKKSQAKKQAKPRQADRPTANEDDASPSTTVEDLMRQLMGEEQPAPVKQQVQQAEQAAPAPFLTVDAPKKADIRQKTGWTGKDRGRRNAPTAPASDAAVFAFDEETFDLRKAVLYNAILQRPYA